MTFEDTKKKYPKLYNWFWNKSHTYPFEEEYEEDFKELVEIVEEIKEGDEQ